MSIEESVDEMLGITGATEVRWRGSAQGLAEIEKVLARIWSDPDLHAAAAGHEDRRVAARTSVLNLVVLAAQPELAERSAAIVARMSGRHPSRTILVAVTDPEGPSEIAADIEVQCAMPRRDVPETWTELIYLRAGGEGGRHVASYVAPLLVHDLPVTMWWPGDAPLGAAHADDLLGLADRLVVDGASWSGDGLDRLRELVRLAGREDLAVFDFALVRQARWREAIASVFDDPELRLTLDRIRTMTVRYASHDPSRDPAGTNLVRPVYHVAWLASRLDMAVDGPFASVAPPAGGTPCHRASLREGGHLVEARLEPVDSPLPAGTTVAVQIGATAGRRRLLADVTAEAETVRARVRVGDQEIRDRVFRARRRTEIELLSEAVEWGGRDPVTAGALQKAGELVGPVDGR